MTPFSVLVVDDEPDTASTLALMLRQYGYDARTAGCLAQAQQVVTAGFAPDAVILDIGLPDSDGYAVAHELCAVLPRRPVLITLTGHQHLEERSRREGMDHHFLKPADPAALVAVLGASTGRTGPAASVRDRWALGPSRAGSELVELGDWLAG
jgi:DNA-binding response OmpR family regulator